MAEKKYIELQKALNVCEMHYEHCLEMHDWSGDTTADNIKRDIETLPTADVEEVRHGYWEASVMGTGAPHCSLCNGVAPSRYTRCPHCGAKMDGGKANDL